MIKFIKLKNKTDSRKQVNNKIFKGKLNLLFPCLVIVLILVVGVRIYNYALDKNTSVAVIDFDEEEIMRVNNQKIVMNEFLLYAADVYQGYNLQNEADWEAEVTDENNNIVTFEDQVKGTICEQIRMTKVLCMKAQDEGIILSEDERKILVDNANTYYAELSKANAINEALTIQLITKFYEENALAQKVYNSILNGYDLNKNELTSNENDNSDLTDKELYFIEVYHDMADGYDKDYDYYTSINWSLLKLLTFSELSKDEEEDAGIIADNKTTIENGIVINGEATTSEIE